MLDFQEGFFQGEIRNNFYVDTTMKTVWAAEMEVLQKVAEICDRHGIIWYAAYGTLLGAIRHEGFIPWDDDMDIWVIRKDYNRLIQLLGKELPESYHVRSALTEEGYYEYHTSVTNGRFSLEREWLEEYHGCPFSVALDIFPLDYLPRDEKESTIQSGMFSVVMGCARTAADLGDREQYKSEEELQESIENIRQGIRCMEENVKARIDLRLIEERKWKQAASELWKWANYIAMMYGEEESDDLVCYVDYARWPGKKFPKEWFAEAWSASFENFMLPVPCGYDQVLRQIYGDYHVCWRGGSTHDYPYYEKQLDEFYAIVRHMQETAGNDSDDKEEVIFPDGWVRLLNGKQNMRKKAVLYTNDISDFLIYGKEALDKLESVLQIFYEAREHILLWWRPRREMVNALMLAEQTEDQQEAVPGESPELQKAPSGMGLSGRYSSILDQYKAAGWGVCDENEDRQRAVEICDAYYGPQNILSGKFQDMGKPVMVASGR